MRLAELAKFAASLDPSIAVFFLGKPGIGKSALSRIVGRLLGPEAVIVRRELTGHLPEDMSGLPFREGNFTKFCPPEFLAKLAKGSGPNGSNPKGVLVLEDITQASRSVQVACFQLVQERSMGEIELSPDVRIILTGNRASDKAGARELPSPLRNRVMLLDLQPDVEEWMSWAGAQGLPGVVGGFLHWRPQFFAQTPDQACKQNSQFATPRAWENVGWMYDTAVDFGKGSLTPLLEASSGLVGCGVATEFVAFVKRIKDLPDPKAILDNPEKVMPVPPTEPDKLVALATALGEYAAKESKSKKDKAIHLKFVRALCHVGGATREVVANGFMVYSANGGDSNTLVKAMADNKNDPKIAALLRFFVAASR